MRPRVLTPTIVVLLAAGVALAGRYEAFTRKAAQGPKMSVVAATYFGDEAVEEFVGAVGLPDGSVLAVGNSWGPQFPAAPQPRILGTGRHAGAPVFNTVKTRSGQREQLDDASPDRTGFIVHYAPNLSAIKSVTRFDWGVASITAVALTKDNQLIIAGRCGPAFPTLARVGAATASAVGGSGSVSVYVAKMDPLSGKLAWVMSVDRVGEDPDKIWIDNAGNMYFTSSGLNKINPAGNRLEKLTTLGSSTASVRTVDPRDGSFYFGGDRNTNTGREPWRQPYYYRFDPTGKEKLLTFWEWKSRGLRDGSLPGIQGDVSDSSPRLTEWTNDGDLLIFVWSDGGNTVVRKQPTDYTKPVPGVPFGMDNSGMKNANSLTHIIRINPETKQAKWIGLWMGYLPDNFQEQRLRGAPNGMNFRSLAVLEDNSFIFSGGAGTGLIQTPGAFVVPPADGSKYGGAYVACFDENMTNLLFSSYMPGCEDVKVARVRNGAVAVSRSRGSDALADRPATPTPTVNALQDKPMGRYDAHILLLRSPGR